MSAGKQKQKKRAVRARPKSKAPGEGEVTVERALELAMQIHRSGVHTGNSGAIAEAQVVYERILAAVPDHPDALQYFGVLLHQTGRQQLGVDMLRRSVQVRPNHAGTWNNLGNVLREQQRTEEAIEAYRGSLALQPDHADAWSNLGVSLRALGKHDEAVSALRRAVSLNPEHAIAHQNLGNALLHLGERSEALGHLRQAIALDPKHPDSHKLLAMALYTAGKTDQAVDVLRGWAKREPNNPVAAHMLAAFTGTSAPLRASDAYVQAQFDAMAGTFDAHLRELGYRAPELVAGAVASLIPRPSRSLDVLDAGCGTGLCGPALRPFSRRLVGVDLSSGMLQLARDGGSYDELVQAELTEYLGRSRDSYELVVSADTLCYFGDLAALMSATSAALRPGGHLVFTVEQSTVGTGPGFRLEPHGRYSHTEQYVRESLTAAGLQVLSVESCELRNEGGRPVAGLLVTGMLAG